MFLDNTDDELFEDDGGEISYVETGDDAVDLELEFDDTRRTEDDEENDQLLLNNTSGGDFDDGDILDDLDLVSTADEIDWDKVPLNTSTVRKVGTL